MCQLVKQKLARAERPFILYKPQIHGLLYRKIRAQFLKYWYRYPWYIVGLAGGSIGGLAAGVPGVIPYLTGMGVAWTIAKGVVGNASVLDTFFMGRRFPRAKKDFRGNPEDWEDLYWKTELKTKKEVDRGIDIAKVASRLQYADCDDDDVARLGVIIARFTDEVAGICVDENGILGLTGKKIKAFANELKKANHSPLDRILLDYLSTLKRPPEDIAVFPTFRNIEEDFVKYRLKEGEQIPEDECLHEYNIRVTKLSELFEFCLKVRAKGLDLAGTQLSKGRLILDGYAGNDCGKDMGVWSEDDELELARIEAIDRVGSRFMVGTQKGMGIVWGDTDHSFLSHVNGAIGINYGSTAHLFCEGMDDQRFPSIGVTYGGVKGTGKKGKMRNGLRFDLARGEFCHVIDGEEIQLDSGGPDASLEEKISKAKKECNIYIERLASERRAA